MANEELTVCPGCERPTKTIGGLCPNCGVLKDAAQAPPGALAPRKLPKSSLLDDELIAAVAWSAPGLAIAALGLVLGTGLVMLAGLALAVLAVLAALAVG